MLTLMFITNQPGLARFAVGQGVDRIFVDLEILGKPERQGHLNTVISRHQLTDVPLVRAAVPNTELLVRLNPLHAGSAAEVESALAGGADLLMLPMYRTPEEVATICRYAAGRAGVVPLLETPEAARCATAVAQLDGVSEVFIGLNDLHLGLGLDFMFEPLADGTVDRLAAELRAVGKPFGFGGVARLDEGLLPGRDILGEHVRLGSASVILSRTFHRLDDTPTLEQSYAEFGTEVRRLRDCEQQAARRPPATVETDRQRVIASVTAIAAARRARRLELAR